MSDPTQQLCEALRDGHNSKVHELINRHGGFNKVVDKYGDTALHKAAMSRQVTILQKIWKMMKPDINHKNNYGYTAQHIAAFDGRLPTIQWFVGHGSDPQAINTINDENETAKDRAKRGKKTEVVEFLEKVESMTELFPLKDVSALNYFSIGNYAEELEEYLANVGTDDPEYLEILKAMETTKLLAIKFESKEVANILDQHFPTPSNELKMKNKEVANVLDQHFPTPSNELNVKKVQKALCLINIAQEMICENDPDEERLTAFNQHLNAAKSIYDTVLEQEF